METINVRVENFVHDKTPEQKFEILSNTQRDVYLGDFASYGVVAPLGLRNGSKAPGKYGADALALQTVLLNAEDDVLPINALASNDAVYFEANIEEKLYAGLIKDNAKKIEYVTEALPKKAVMLPYVLYNLRDSLKTGAKPDPNSKQDVDGVKLLFAHEYRERYAAILEEYFSDGSVSSDAMAIFSDCFDYGYLRQNRALVTEVEENTAGLLETVRQAVKSKELKPMSIFKNISTIKFTNFEEEDIPAPAGRLPDSEMMKEAKKGSYRIKYPWSAEQRAKIPSLSYLESYVANKHFFTLLNKYIYRYKAVNERREKGMTGTALIGSDIINAFLLGKPGTGKTTTLYALGAALGLPVYSIALNKHTESDTFEGMNKFVDGKLQFVATEFLKAFTEPSIIILEEVNLADPGVVMGALGQAVEFPYILMKDGYIPVLRGANTAIFGAMNIGTYGSRGVSQAFSSRFKQSYILDDPTKEQFIDILHKNHPQLAECEWVYNAYSKIIAHLEDPANGGDEEMTLNVTLRGCQGALEDIAEGNDPYQAIRDTLVGKIRESATAGEANRIWEEVVQNLPPIY